MNVIDRVEDEQEPTEEEAKAYELGWRPWGVMSPALFLKVHNLVIEINEILKDKEE